MRSNDLTRSTRLRLWAGLAAGALVAAIPVAATAAGASTAPKTGSLVKLQQGFNVHAIPGATVFGNTPSDTPETVSFVLKANDLGSLEAKATGGYFTAKNFLSVGQFAREYGQQQVAAALTAYLAKYGISTTVYKYDLDVSANGTAGEFDSALTISAQQQVHVPALTGRDGARPIPAQTIHAPASSPELPRDLGDHIVAVLGLANYNGEFTD